MKTMQFRFLIEGRAFTARMQDTALVREIAAMCPIRQSWQRSGDHEYYTRLRKSVHAAGEKGTSEIRKNRLYLFPAWNAFSITFREMSIAPYKVIELGEFEENVSSVLETAPDDLRILCEAETR